MLQYITRQTRVPSIHWLGNKKQTPQLAPFKQNEHLKHKKSVLKSIELTKSTYKPLHIHCCMNINSYLMLQHFSYCLQTQQMRVRLAHEVYSLKNISLHIDGFAHSRRTGFHYYHFFFCSVLIVFIRTEAEPSVKHMTHFPLFND